MAVHGLLEHNDLCANQLLSFVSNASKELKDMLGTVDKDSRSEQIPAANIIIPSPRFLSPVPSPTPSSVSSFSDQEVPSMSPGFVKRKTQRRSRKRDSDSMSEASMLDYPVKVRRADSVGDYEETTSFMATKTHPYMAQHPTAPYQQLPAYQPKSYKQTSSCQYDNLSQHAVYIDRLQPRLQYPEEAYSYQHVSSQVSWPTQITNYPQNIYPGQQESYPDFADLVSWMLAENFLDTESLTALLTQC